MVLTRSSSNVKQATSGIFWRVPKIIFHAFVIVMLEGFIGGLVGVFLKVISWSNMQFVFGLTLFGGTPIGTIPASTNNLVLLGQWMVTLIFCMMGPWLAVMAGFNTWYLHVTGKTLVFPGVHLPKTIPSQINIKVPPLPGHSSSHPVPKSTAHSLGGFGAHVQFGRMVIGNAARIAYARLHSL